MEQALAWHLRLRDGDEAAWEEFTAWLESDPAHNAAYEEVAARDAALDSILQEANFAAPDNMHPAAANDEGPPPASKGWRWLAIAASLVLVAMLAAQLLTSGSDRYVVATSPGETRTIALSDGGQIVVNGGSEIVLDHEDARFAELVAGEAHFTVVHDASAPFVVTVGEDRLVDIGTVFNVLREDGELHVAVAEGAVRYEGGRNVELDAGEAMRLGADGNIQVSTLPVEAIGGWVDGMLVYDATPIGELAADIERSTGIAIALDPELEGRSFSGVIQTTGDDAALRGRLQDLLGVTVDSDETGWTLRP
ncbi:FecR family protein [Alteraurantiacibacter aquimixticola]|uniref:DUF4880 domain-containing protein n=1 Tax=Alteraurantiacibacter aquimixticola TaxID=2489173 RepID=A0A4T3F1N5_9SPHN|nr:FecR domain-containing protein [Alteraurantiacibacter aquimixticola]TIX51115.1 DUF4880 domain-containing protein [Alteraurantiacibacter aquimixticola]